MIVEDLNANESGLLASRHHWLRKGEILRLLKFLNDELEGDYHTHLSIEQDRGTIQTSWNLLPTIALQTMGLHN